IRFISKHKREIFKICQICQNSTLWGILTSIHWTVAVISNEGCRARPDFFQRKKSTKAPTNIKQKNTGSLTTHNQFSGLLNGCWMCRMTQPVNGAGDEWVVDTLESRFLLGNP